jgi:hypothetical protein
MMTNTQTSRPHRLSDIPLWKLLVALDDAERSLGPKSDTTRVLARHIQERLRKERQPQEARRAQ